ncbi:MAG TPA: sugar phosphate isomerase/epimerase family protein [Ktedonobacterales bacterium]
MSDTTTFVLSAFGDEIDSDLAVQLDVLSAIGIHHLELRGAWGRNVLDLGEEDLARAKALLDERGFGVSAIGSPIGKSALSEPRDFEVGRLGRAIEVADALGTRLIRVFSFYVANDEAEQRRGEVLARMALLAERAKRAGVTLLHENEKDIYGDTAARCHDLLTSIDSPALRLAFDPANFVQVGVRPMADAWPLLAEYVAHVHIKDAVFSDGTVRPAGEGDGDIQHLLEALVKRGYSGFLTLEPHLQVAGPSSGYSGEAGMRAAAAALRGLLTALPPGVPTE